MKRCAILLLALALLAGAAQAASLDGELTFSAPVLLKGGARWRATEGGLDLAPTVLRGEAPDLTWTSASGYQTTRVREFYGPQGEVEPFVAYEPSPNETLDFAEGKLRNVTCHAFCRIFLYTEPGAEAAFTLEGQVAAPLQVLSAPAVRRANAEGPGAPESFWWAAPPGWLSLGGAPSLTEPSTPLAGARAEALGALGLLIANATGEIEAGGEVWAFDTRERVEDTMAPGGVSVVRRAESPFIVLRLTDARVALASGTSALLLTPSATFELDGHLRSARAEGFVVVGGERREVRDESVLLRGALSLAPAGTAPDLLEGARIATWLAGDAREVLVAGEPVGASFASEVSGVAAGLGLVALLAGAMLVLHKAGWLPFYTRLDRANLLDNPNRRRLFELVRERPGLGLSDLSRAAGMAQAVTRHHLRMLIAHHYVVVHREGRARAFFAAEAGHDERRSALHTMLRDPSRRQVADLLAHAPSPLSQKDLVHRSGLSQRLISYHLTRLEAECLVTTEGTMPRRYRATAELRSFLLTHPAAGA